MIPRRFAIACAVALVAASVVTLAPPAQAAPQTAEPALLTIGWWWKDAQSEEQDIAGNKVVVDTPSPFCPGLPANQGDVPGACADGRFPVEIRGGEYEEPHMLSGLGFDLSYLTPGSEVFKFELKLLEAESGCYDGRDDDEECTPGTAEGDHFEQTDPIGPVDERQVKACLLTQIFGDSSGRPYREVPNYECPSDAPTAERKEIKTLDPDTDTDEVDHVWTFDLTDYAQEWADEFSVATNIMIVGEPPKGAADDPQDTWRVVFAGPRSEKGIQAKLVYEPGEIAPPPPPPPGTTTSTGGFTGGTSTSFGGGTTSGPSFGGTTDAGTGTDAGGEEPAPAEIPGLDIAGAEGPAIEGMPAYVWLALLAGLIAFTMVRQVVVESATGIRPNGVLAKIHALNAERRGIDLAAASAGPSPLAGLAAVGSAIGKRFSSLLSKLPGRG